MPKCWFSSLPAYDTLSATGLNRFYKLFSLSHLTNMKNTEYNKPEIEKPVNERSTSDSFLLQRAADGEIAALDSRSNGLARAA